MAIRSSIWSAIFQPAWVKPERRGQGAGRRLYEDLAQAAVEAQAKKLQVSIQDNCPECRSFAERRGFVERSHIIGMALDLEAFDDRPYDEIIAKLKGEGVQFTSGEGPLESNWKQ